MTDRKLTSLPEGPETPGGCGLDRRDFLGAGVAAVATALTGCGTLSKEEFLQHNFQELSKEEVLSVIARLEKEYKAKYGRDVKVGTTPPMPGVIFGYALDLSRCIGCRRCVHACVKENNQSRSPEVQWIRVLELDKEEGGEQRGTAHGSPVWVGGRAAGVATESPNIAISVARSG